MGHKYNKTIRQINNKLKILFMCLNKNKEQNENKMKSKLLIKKK